MKINMGCGWRNFGDDWVHIDGGSYEHLDYHDICTLPFEDETVDVIYASHVIEYFNRTEILSVLKEWKRVLKPGATLRLAVPDFESLVRLYSLDSGFTLENVLGPLFGQMKMGEDTIYHRTVYDFESLKKVLEDCGFSNVEHFDWRDTDHAHFDDHSQAYYPHLDKDNGTLISLNVEAKK